MADQPDLIESLSVYIPMDRRQALADGESLPFNTTGSALFADISGFTALTEALAQELGARRGAEELTRYLNQVYDALIAELHRYRGSVIGFSGDAITCWLDGDDGRRAVACAVAMQAAMDQFAVVKTRLGRDLSLSMKIAVAVGPVRRFLVGDKELLVVDAMAGATLDRLAAGEHLAEKKEIVLDPAAAAALADGLEVREWRVDPETGDRYAVLADLKLDVPADPWPPVPAAALPLDKVRPWLLPPVYTRLQSDQGEFLAELRPAVALFFRFGGIDYDRDETAAFKLDEFMVLVTEILDRYEASLIQLTIGDKGSYFYAAFGAPVAHEDDAVRAAAAALDLHALAIRLAYIEDVQIGITQGRMRTGAYGSATRRTYGVLGDAVNLAARLMQAAQPGQILVADEVRRAAGEAFGWDPLPPLQVKGKTQIAAVFGLERPRERRAFRLQEPSYSLPMIGRQTEIDLVRARLDQVVAGKGQVIGITAEAGMGKSRLAAEIIRLGVDLGLEVLGGEAQSFGKHTSYLIWQSVWRSFFEIEPEWPLGAMLSALESQLAAIDSTLVPRYPLLGPVLNLEIPDTDLTRALDAKLRKSSLEALLVDSLRGRVREDPLLLLLEDCHWLDPLSQDLLEVIGRAVANLPVLIVLTYRPTDEVHFKGVGLDQLAHFTEFVLSDFTVEEARTLIQLKLEQIFGSLTSVPQALVTLITERAGGNPFYVEELLNYLKDRQIDPGDSRALAQLDLPTSLHSLILSRIDQLTESQKIVLKVASVIGRLFQAVMIWGVYPELGDSDRVRADLDLLSRMEITSLDSPEPELTYLFKHIITQQVAYENLPFATRARLHEQIGFYLEDKATEGTGQFVDLLAYHFGQSQNEAKQREYYLKAGEAAQADYANLAAMEYYRRLLSLLSETDQIEVQLKLGAVLELVGEWDEAGEQYQAAFALAEKLGDDQSRGECQHAVGRLMMKQGQYAGALRWLEQSREVFRALEQPGRRWPGPA